MATQSNLAAVTIAILMATPVAATAQNYYAQQNIQREHDQYIQRQTERNTRYTPNSGSSDMYSVADYAAMFRRPEPSYQTTAHIKDAWEQSQYARAHPLETGLAAYLASHTDSPPPQQTPAQYAAEVKAVAATRDPESKEAYANCLYNGFGVTANKAEAYKLYREAAALRPSAEFIAAGMLIAGEGVPSNVAEGIALMKHAADAGNADAADYMARVDGTYTPESVEASAAKGDYDPMMRLGFDYEDGQHGRAKDPAKAFGYMKRAAENGNPRAQTFFGDMYEFGEGTAVSHADAIKWYKSADVAQDETAPAAISAFYRANGGATPAEILAWAQKAVTVNPKAGSYLELGAVQLSQHDETSARQNFAKAAELGNRQGLGLTGIYEWRGVAGPQDMENGYKHLLAAAEQGDARANNELGEAYRFGHNGIAIDSSAAIDYFQKAAETGYNTAQYNIAMLYYDGFGVEQSYKNSAIWALKAAKQNQPDAQYLMALLAQAFTGPELGPENAVKWMQSAAENGSTDAKESLAKGFDGK